MDISPSGSGPDLQKAEPKKGDATGQRMDQRSHAPSMDTSVLFNLIQEETYTNESGRRFINTHCVHSPCMCMCMCMWCLNIQLD